MIRDYRKTVVVITGPTASGKSQFALDLAKDHQGVIINADSLQLYHHLPLLSAHPSPQDFKDIKHYLYGILNPRDQWNAVYWGEQVINLLKLPELKDQLPILVGGTGLYIKGLVEGLSPVPPYCPKIREQALERFHQIGYQKFTEEIAQFDPFILQRLNINDRQRLTRAWEVYYSTGRPLSYWQDLPKICKTKEYCFVIFLLNPLRSDLKKYASQRLLQMLDQGALSEVQALIDEQIPATAPVYRTLGARPLENYLRKIITLDQAINLTQTATHQYIKRQQTWFQHQLSNFHLINQIYSKEALRSAQSMLKEFIH